MRVNLVFNTGMEGGLGRVGVDVNLISVTWGGIYVQI
jgi:hypothetical protein